MAPARPAPPAGQGSGPADLRWLFFSPEGRIDRQIFALAWLFLLALNGFFFSAILAQPAESAGLLFWSLAGLAGGIATLFASALVSVKRLHDAGLAGAFVVLLFVPMISIFFLVALCLWPGTYGPNAYGRQTNSRR